jgi:4-amino-4-deoxy-L-arabinose transferase-like glycosyltransferase
VSRSRRRSALLALGGLLVLGAALRLPGLAYGLPFPLLNPDERSIVPRAWELVHGGGLDPGWYDYPSLLLAVLAPLQVPFDEPSYGAARIVAAAIGLGGVAAAWWVGRSAYGAAAGVLAGAACAVSTVHVVYSHMAVTDVLLTTLVTISLALLLTGRLEWAGVAAGLAASAKYPGILLAVPMLLVGWRQWRRLGLAAGGAVLAFLVTSPFVVIHAGAAWDDIERVQRLGRAGWLGFEDDPATPLAYLDRLWDGLGPFLLVAAAGLVLALAGLAARRDKELRRADLVLVSFALVWFAQLLPLNAHHDRYVLPLVPVLGALAGRLPRLAPAALALLVVPLIWSVGEVRELTRTDTRVVAQAWIEQNVPPDALVAAEPSTPSVDPRPTLGLELPGPGRELDPNRELERLRARGADYVLVTGAVADRVLAAADRYPREAAFYGELESAAERVLLVSPGGELGGPWVALYRL